MRWIVSHALRVLIICLCAQLTAAGSELTRSERATLLQDTLFSSTGSADGSEAIRVRANTEVRVLEHSQEYLIVEHFGVKARVKPEDVQFVSAPRETRLPLDKQALFDEARQRKKDVEQEQMSLWGLEARTLSGEVLSVLEDGILLKLAGLDSRILKVITRKDVVDGDRFKAMAMPLESTFTYQAASGGVITVRVWKDIEAQ